VEKYSLQAEVENMIGDINIFYNDYDDSGRVEIDVMIAEPMYRHSGYGKEAVILMLHYCINTLGVLRFYCKISEDNHPSLRLFRRLSSCTM
jgi:RimJ/RimL family protein N-acetyltransferase